VTHTEADRHATIGKDASRERQNLSGKPGIPSVENKPMTRIPHRILSPQTMKPESTSRQGAARTAIPSALREPRCIMTSKCDGHGV